MKTTQSTLRVSHLTYIRVMDSVIAEVAALAPAEAVSIINAVVAYLHSADAAVAGDNDILRRYFDIIDRAALRSARARQAALKRRKAKEEPTMATEPIDPISPISQISPIRPIPPKPTRPRIKIKHKTLHRNTHRYHGSHTKPPKKAGI